MYIVSRNIAGNAIEYAYGANGNVTYGNNRNSADYYAYGLPTSDSNVKFYDSYLYGGKKLYSNKGINLYDFHARTYAPDIARFMQPDPMAGDYHWLSPYSFCGSDPINYVDPTGRILETVCNGITYTWEYRVENGWGFYDQDGQLYDGDDLFLLNLQKDLMKLISGTTGYKIVNKLVDSPSVTTISNGTSIEDNSTSYVYKDNKGTVNMDYDNPVTPMYTFVALGHELVHAIMGKHQTATEELVIDGKKIKYNTSEIYATHYENMIRAEHGLELRACYSDGKTFEIKLIDPKSRTSLFYNFPLSFNKKNVPYHYFRYIK